jgi:hypothetical protein
MTSMNNPNLTLLEVAVRLLEPLLDDLVFAGGCVVMSGGAPCAAASVV